MKNEDKSEKLSKYLDIIENRADAMKQLTEELFKFSVVMSENGEYENETSSITVYGIELYCVSSSRQLLYRDADPGTESSSGERIQTILSGRGIVQLGRSKWNHGSKREDTPF